MSKYGKKENGDLNRSRHFTITKRGSFVVNYQYDLFVQYIKYDHFLLSLAIIRFISTMFIGNYHNMYIYVYCICTIVQYNYNYNSATNIFIIYVFEIKINYVSNFDIIKTDKMERKNVVFD